MATGSGPSTQFTVSGSMEVSPCDIEAGRFVSNRAGLGVFVAVP
ncbi:MAG: hypothetical protein AB7G13_18775 [Lautropia sp.]